MLHHQCYRNSFFFYLLVSVLVLLSLFSLSFSPQDKHTWILPYINTFGHSGYFPESDCIIFKSFGPVLSVPENVFKQTLYYQRQHLRIRSCAWVFLCKRLWILYKSHNLLSNLKSLEALMLSGVHYAVESDFPVLQMLCMNQAQNLFYCIPLTQRQFVSALSCGIGKWLHNTKPHHLPEAYKREHF